SRAVRVVVRSACAFRDARCGVAARSLVLHCAKTLVFLPRCSNANAVRAIPAGTGRYRHSLMARRAAWRRSEGRRRRQRKRARRRPSAGRRSKRAPRISLRLRTTSMTASNGPAGVELRWAHRGRRCRPPSTPAGGGETRARASSISVPGAGEEEAAEHLRTSPQHNSAAGLVAPALADALGIFLAPARSPRQTCGPPALLDEYR